MYQEIFIGSVFSRVNSVFLAYTKGPISMSTKEDILPL